VADAGAPSPATRVAGRRPWLGRRVVLGVTGGIAAYKSVQLARDLALHGSDVDVVMSAAARVFVGPLSFEALTGRPVLFDLLATEHALDHIRVAREADVVCVAPATADFLARAAIGRADDLLAAILLATRAPVLLVPAMNDRMWGHPQTQTNVAHLRTLGYDIVGPASGPLAWDEGEGPGRMEEPLIILQHIGRALGVEPTWRDRRVLVTAGPTREPVDAVRVLSNRSSGRMGLALAAAAWRRGADVVLVTGPTQLPLPVGPRVLRVQTADEMAHAVGDELQHASVLLMAAAVADFRPAQTVAGKIKKDARPAALELEPAPDILSVTRSRRRGDAVIVGFALETGDGREPARAKLRDKGLDLIVLNPADEKDAGFDAETNRVTFLDAAGGEESLPLLGKDEVADAILDRVRALLESRS
jgi:phosphopantothenoylcysteine decarboxylase/phosphopantothenate--cysteine ligase